MSGGIVAPNVFQQATLTSSITTTSTTLVDATGLSITLSAARGSYHIVFTARCSHNTAGNAVFAVIDDNGTDTSEFAADVDQANRPFPLAICTTGSSTGQVIKVQWRVSTGTGTIVGEASGTSRIVTFVG